MTTSNRPQVGIGRHGPVLVLSSAATAMTVAQVLDNFNAKRIHNGLLPMPELIDVVAACRQLHALAQLVPQSEPRGDGERQPPTQWVSTGHLARRLGISQRAVTKRITTGALTAHKVGGRWLIDAKESTRAT